jgi:F-type H+-transporting ATPase subunit a
VEETGRMGLQFALGDQQIFIHDTLVNSVVIVLILSIFFMIMSRKIKATDPTKPPKGVMHILEIFVTGINSYVASTMGKKGKGFEPYIGMLAIYLAIANLLGLIGFTPPTSDYNVTLALAIMTFFLTQFFGFRSQKLGYFKSFTEPFALLLPINLLGEIANPVSLSFRLFGNIVSGALIMGLLYGALGWFAPILAPALHAYFDIFAGLIQTFIFTILTMIFISGAMED